MALSHFHKFFCFSILISVLSILVGSLFFDNNHNSNFRIQFNGFFRLVNSLPNHTDDKLSTNREKGKSRTYGSQTDVDDAIDNNNDFDNIQFDPIAWVAPENKGFVGSFKRNWMLSQAVLIPMKADINDDDGNDSYYQNNNSDNDLSGPECVAEWPIEDNPNNSSNFKYKLLTGTRSGDVLLIEIDSNDNNNNKVKILGNTGGVSFEYHN